MKRPEELDRERRRILRRIGLVTWALGAAAVALAVAGGALVAWLLSGAGLPFVRTWIILILILLLVPVALHVAPWPKRRDRDQGG